MQRVQVVGPHRRQALPQQEQRGGPARGAPRPPAAPHGSGRPAAHRRRLPASPLSERAGQRRAPPCPALGRPPRSPGRGFPREWGNHTGTPPPPPRGRGPSPFPGGGGRVSPRPVRALGHAAGGTRFPGLRVPGQLAGTPAEQRGSRPTRFTSTQLPSRAGKGGRRYCELVLKSPAEQRAGSSTQAQDRVLRKEVWRMSFPFRFRKKSRYPRVESLPHRRCAEGSSLLPPVGDISFLNPVPQKPGTVSLAYPCCARLLTADGSFLSRVM